MNAPAHHMQTQAEHKQTQANTCKFVNSAFRSAAGRHAVRMRRGGRAGAAAPGRSAPPPPPFGATHTGRAAREKICKSGGGGGAERPGAAAPARPPRRMRTAWRPAALRKAEFTNLHVVLLVFACGVLVRSCNSVRPHKQTQANTSKHKHSTSTQVFARSNRVLLVICLLQANTSMHKQTQADHKQIQAKTSSRRKTTGKHKQITSKHMQTQANASKHKQTTNKHKQAHADNQQTQADHKQTQAEHKQTQAHTSKDHPSFGTRHDTPIDA
eukprot:gene23145-biopygen5807